jgi:hypothetical protein
MCADELPSGEQHQFRSFSRLLASLIHHRFARRIETLKDAYYPFQPQSDTRTVRVVDAAAREVARARVEQELTQLATAANYIPMSLAEVEEALRRSSVLKLRLEIDKSDVDSVLLFRRGETQETREEKGLFGLWKKTVSFPQYARVLVYTKFKEAQHFTNREAEKLPFRPGSIIVKLFQNVPREDLEMIFPNVRIRMRLVDKIFIGVPAVASGIVVIIAKLFAVVTFLWGLLIFWLKFNPTEPDISRTKLATTGLALFAVGTYVVRQLSNFKNRKISFMKALSENLYYRNLDNDAGVFHHLLDAAEEAEVIEAVLAYHFLHQAGTALTADELDQRVEQWFVRRWNTRFDFEVDDGLRKLRELGLVTVIPGAQERLSPLSLVDATRVLDRLWDDAYTDGEPATVQQPALGDLAAATPPAFAMHPVPQQGGAPAPNPAT